MDLIEVQKCYKNVFFLLLTVTYSQINFIIIRITGFFPPGTFPSRYFWHLGIIPSHSPSFTWVPSRWYGSTGRTAIGRSIRLHWVYWLECIYVLVLIVLHMLIFMLFITFFTWLIVFISLSEYLTYFLFRYFPNLNNKWIKLTCLLQIFWLLNII